jgi:hypothetical protein
MDEIEKKLASLDSYRPALDENEKELFDLLMGYARELLESERPFEDAVRCPG